MLSRVRHFRQPACPLDTRLSTRLERDERMLERVLNPRIGRQLEHRERRFGGCQRWEEAQAANRFQPHPRVFVADAGRQATPVRWAEYSRFVGHDMHRGRAGIWRLR